jgi:hypothetical protein
MSGGQALSCTGSPPGGGRMDSITKEEVSMKKRMTLILAAVVVVLVAIVPLQGSVAGVLSQQEAVTPEAAGPIEDLSHLLNYPYEAHIMELTGQDRTDVITDLFGRPETQALIVEMAPKGFVFDLPYLLDNAVAMHISIPVEAGPPVEVDAMTVSMIANELTGALTAMQPVAPDPAAPGFYQAHHTNLDPNLADVPDPAIVVNGMPYFYITTLRWIGPTIGGRIMYWHYWWYDSHNHPNWYYAHYYWYWQYYGWYMVDWPYWYWWVHGWYYWQYWYYWSTYFPW